MHFGVGLFNPFRANLQLRICLDRLCHLWCPNSPQKNLAPIPLTWRNWYRPVHYVSRPLPFRFPPKVHRSSTMSTFNYFFFFLPANISRVTVGILQYTQGISQNLEGTRGTPCLNFSLLERSEPKFFEWILRAQGAKPVEKNPKLKVHTKWVK